MPDRFLFVFGHEPWLLPPAIEMAMALNQSGFSTKLLYIGLQGNCGDLPDELPVECFFRGKGIWQRLKDQSTLASKISKESFDHIIACDLVALQSVFFSITPKSKVIFWAFEVYQRPERFKLSLDFLRLLSLGFLVKGIKCILFPSESRRDRFYREYKSKTPAHIVFNTRCVSSSHVLFEKEESKVIKGDRKVRIVYSGRFSESQFADEILKSTRLLPEGFQLIICGVSSQEYIDRMALFPNVEHLGRLELSSMAELLHGCDIGLCLYNKSLSIDNYDPAPNKVSDYIASGLRILSTDQSYFKQIVEKNNIGLTIERVTPEAIAASIGALSASDMILNKEGIIAFQRNRFNMNMEARKFLKGLEILE